MIAIIPICTGELWFGLAFAFDFDFGVFELVFPELPTIIRNFIIQR
jgi:hypothetical protein